MPRLTPHNLMVCSVGDGLTTYRMDSRGAWVMVNDAQDLLEKYEHALLTIDLMRRAADVETVRAIAAVAMGDNR